MALKQDVSVMRSHSTKTNMCVIHIRPQQDGLQQSSVRWTKTNSSLLQWRPCVCFLAQTENVMTPVSNPGDTVRHVFILTCHACPSMWGDNRCCERPEGREQMEFSRRGWGAVVWKKAMTPWQPLYSGCLSWQWRSKPSPSCCRLIAMRYRTCEGEQPILNFLFSESQQLLFL